MLLYYLKASTDINNAVDTEVSNRRSQHRRDREIQPNPKDKTKDKPIDLTGFKPPKKRNTVRSGLGDYSSSNSTNNNVIFMAISEGTNKGLDSDKEDEYEKYNQMWDGQADEILLASGATIIRSEMELTDSQGRNRKLVRRDSEAFHY